MILNARDYSTLQDALDAAADGDRVYVPAGVWTTPATGSFVIHKSIELYGDGPGRSEAYDGTVLVPGSDELSVIVIEPQSPNTQVRSVYIHDLKIRPRPIPGVTTDGRDGIRCALTSGQKVLSIRIERVQVQSMGGGGFADQGAMGIRLSGANTTDSYIDMVELSDVVLILCTGNGLYLNNVRHAHICRSEIASHKQGHLYATATAVGLTSVGFADGIDPTYHPVTNIAVRLVNCPIAHIEACRFEDIEFVNDQTPQPPANVPSGNVACQLEGCRGAAVVACCVFSQGRAPDATEPYPRNATGIYVKQGCGPVVIWANAFTKVFSYVVLVHSAVPGVVVGPQYNFRTGGRGPGILGLPTGAANGGMYGAPLVVRNTGPTTDGTSGVVLPQLGADPSAATTQNGAVYHNTTLGRPRILAGGQWRSFTLVP